MSTMAGITVPFNDLQRQYLSIRSEIDEAIASVIASSAFVRGPFVDDFEAKFARRLGAAHCVSCANGTDALYIVMMALGIKPGDEVIVPAMSWISTSETVTQAGGRVVFCDIDPVTYTIDVEAIADKVTSRTVGVIPVHLYGQPADVEGVLAVAARFGLWVLEDCAQAHLASYNGKLVGTFGVAGTFSFYPGKNLGAMGDGGAIVTSDGALAERMAMFARHGGLKKGEHRIEGINSRLDGIQAALLTVKLRYLDQWTQRRQQIAHRYTKALSHLPGVGVPAVASGREHVWHLYVVEHEDRQGMAAWLRSAGVATVVNYPIALPFLPCYEYLQHRAEDFPVASRVQSMILSLPIFPEMTDHQLDLVQAAIAEFAHR